MPADVVEGSLVAEAAVYPTPLASLTAALEALLREPCGCFEQTSSSNYPNVMALQYLKSHAGVAPELVARAQALLARGYQKLTSFECREKGYEWFGGDPGHEALTAYGLLEFADMAQVMAVDPEMLARTRAWLRSRRDGKGGFQRNARALDTFGGAPEDVTNAYIVWALVEGGERDLGPEVAAVKALADRTDDPYVLALVAATLRRLEDPAALPILARLGKRQAADGAMPARRPRSRARAASRSTSRRPRSRCSRGCECPSSRRRSSAAWRGSPRAARRAASARPRRRSSR